MKESLERLVRLMRSEFDIDVMRRVTNDPTVAKRKKSSEDEGWARAVITNALSQVYSANDGKIADLLLKDRTTILYYRRLHESRLTHHKYRDMFLASMEMLAEDDVRDPVNLTSLIHLIRTIA